MLSISVVFIHLLQGMGLADGGAFACRALNARGIATSRTARVSVTPRFEPTENPTALLRILQDGSA